MSKIIRIYECPPWCTKKSHHNGTRNNEPIITENLAGGSLYCNATNLFLFKRDIDWFKSAFNDPCCIMKYRMHYE
jgi:hypothetical protein